MNATQQRADRALSDWVDRADLELDLDVDDLELRLRRYGGEQNKKAAVLLLHGASANSYTFLVPDGGLTAHLLSQGFEVWTLDWRASSLVVDPLLEKLKSRAAIEKERALFNLDRAVEQDFVSALRIVRERIGEDTPLSVVAHCFGAGALSIAVARGLVEPFRIRAVVLSTLGLFYEAPWDGWMKAEDFIVERILAHAPDCRGLSPRAPGQWPSDMQEAYAMWPKSWLPDGDSEADHIFRRVTFMFGMPYLRPRLAPGIHEALLPRLFGHMHLGLYLHAGQMVRRGYAAPFDAPDVIDRPRIRRAANARPARFAHQLDTDLHPHYFADKRVTLITGGQNRLWHRDSIDSMYEFLRRGRRSDDVTKHVLRSYAHQDLLWATTAQRDVYPVIAAGL